MCINMYAENFTIGHQLFLWAEWDSSEKSKQRGKQRSFLVLQACVFTL